MLFVYFEEDEVFFLFYEVYRVYRVEEVFFRIFLMSCFDDVFVDKYVVDGNVVFDVEVFVKKLIE